MEGFLQKRPAKGLVKKWRKRYFVLKGSKLTWSEDKGGTDLLLFVKILTI